MAHHANWKYATPVTAFAISMALTMSTQAANKKPIHSTAPATALVGGTLINGRGDPVIHNSTIIIQGKIIVAVGSAKTIEIPNNARIISIPGKSVLPGLIDAHIHISGSGGGSREPGEYGPRAISNNLRSYLKFGVTTVFDMAGNPFIDAQKKAISTGRMIGPRLFGVKYGITAPGGHPLQLLKKIGRLKILGTVYYTIANEA